MIVSNTEKDCAIILWETKLFQELSEELESVRLESVRLESVRLESVRLESVRLDVSWYLSKNEKGSSLRNGFYFVHRRRLVNSSLKLINITVFRNRI